MRVVHRRFPIKAEESAEVVSFSADEATELEL